MNKFSDLGLSQKTLEVLTTIGFETPTPIQEEAIPVLLDDNSTDFIGIAQTGTGKTAAFGLPLIEMIDMDNPATQALIMAPTRELGQQTAQQLVNFTQNNKHLNVEVVYGGAAITNQIKALKKTTQIVVATPGRLLDLIKRKAIDLQEVKYVVLDEADEMLNMGFKEDIDEILSYTREDRSIWLFTATMPADIRKIVHKYMDHPKEVSVNTGEKINKDIIHQYVITKTAHKISAIKRFLDIQPDMRGIMFCRTRRETQKIADELGNLGYGVETLHGDLSQGQRDSVMRRFKNRAMQLLIATDVAARGIDVNDLTHVFHHTLPDQIEYYTHRAGRTARAGKTGISLAFINPREGKRITELEKKNKVKFEHVEVPTREDLRSSRINSWANLIINTKVDEQSEEILQELHGQFAHLSKEDILRRLITTQLDHLSVQGETLDNLNEKDDKKRESAGKQSKSGFHRYFINVGLIDGVTKSDLIHFISDISEIKRKYIGEIRLQKNCAFFDVDANYDKDLSSSFRGIDIEGRSIRVNRDDEGNKRDRPSYEGRKKNKRKSGGKNISGRRKERKHYGKSKNTTY